MTELSKIAQKYLTDKGTTYYHSHYYTEIYDDYFQQFKNENRKINILEIGVQCGYDLLMINEYFEGNCEIWGLDIDLSNLQIELPSNIHVIEMNAADINELNNWYKSNEYNNIYTLPYFDIIIDDGSHQSNDILQSMIFLHDKLSKNGIYIVEDLHANCANMALQFITLNNINNDELINMQNKIIFKAVYYHQQQPIICEQNSICAILKFKQ